MEEDGLFEAKAVNEDCPRGSCASACGVCQDIHTYIYIHTRTLCCSAGQCVMSMEKRKSAELFPAGTHTHTHTLVAAPILGAGL